MKATNKTTREDTGIRHKATITAKMAARRTPSRMKEQMRRWALTKTEDICVSSNESKKKQKTM